MAISFKGIGTIHEIGSRRWSKKEIAGAIKARANVLVDNSIGRGSTVALVHGGSGQFFADLFAIWACGAAAACLDPALTEQELKTVTSFLKPDAVLCGRTPPPIGGDIMTISLCDVPVLAGGDSPTVHARDGDPALILFTSGTTGSPKGVVLSFAAIAARLDLNIREIGEQALSRTLLSLPTHFGHGLIGNALTPVLAGGDLVIPPPGISLARDLGTLIRDFEITFLTSVPALWRLATKFGDPLDATKLARVHVGSAPLPVSLWDEIAEWTGATVFNCYGMTETAGWISGASSNSGDLHEGLVGKTWGGDAAVLAPDGTISPSGEGEIVIRSPSRMTDYLREEEMTKHAFRADWLRTGDLGHIAEDGSITLAGRVKDEINRAGFKVQPAEIDALLLSKPGVEAACVFALPDTASGEIVAAALQLAPGGKETEATLRGWCLDRVRRELVPERWFFVESITETSRGKTDRDNIRLMCLENEKHNLPE